MSDNFTKTWAGRVGMAFDRLCNAVVFDGSDTETVSHHTAIAAQEGKAWGCVGCWLLGVLVQKNHCGLTLDPSIPETTSGALRAGLVMAAATGLTVFAIRRAWEELRRI